MSPAPDPADLRHVFISFAHADRAAAERVGDLLDDADVPYWADFDSLQVGTPDWEAAIRKALAESYAVVYLASPSSRGSVYVKGELDVARSKSVPVFPAWVAGDVWADSAPLDLIAAQYADLRGDRFDAGGRALVARLTEHVGRLLPDCFPVSPLRHGEKKDGYTQTTTRTPPPGYACVEFGDPDRRAEPGRGVMVKVARHPDLASFLDAVYVEHLSDVYPPLTYGTEWVLVGRGWGGRRVAVPLAWVRTRGRVHDWARTVTPADVGIRPGTHWHAAPPPADAVGVASDEPELAEVLLENPKAEPIMLDRGLLRFVPVQEAEAANHAHAGVIAGRMFAERRPGGASALVPNPDAADAVKKELAYWVGRFRR
jgi:hypothetical protein